MMGHGSFQALVWFAVSSFRLEVPLGLGNTTFVDWDEVQDDASGARAGAAAANAAEVSAFAAAQHADTLKGRRFTEMIQRIEERALQGGNCGYERESDDESFIADDDELDVLPERVTKFGGFFVQNTAKSAVVPSVDVDDDDTLLHDGAVSTVASAAAAAAAAGLPAVAGASAVSGSAVAVGDRRVFPGASPVLSDALNALHQFWTALLVQRGSKGVPTRMPTSIYPYAFDIAYQAKLAHPKHNITAEVVEHVATVLPQMELDSIRALLKRAFKAGVSYKEGVMTDKVALLDAAARGSQATTATVVAGALPLTSSSANVAAPLTVAAAATTTTTITAANTFNASSTATVKTPAAMHKLLMARRAAVERLLAVFRETLDGDIAAGKITEPVPQALGESESKRRAQVFWRPQLKQLLGECVDAEFAAREAELLHSLMLQKRPAEIDAVMRDNIRSHARESICNKVLAHWPAGWMTLAKVRSTYASYYSNQQKKQLTESSGGGAVAAPLSSSAVASTSIKSIASAPAAAAAAAAAASGWKARKRYVCVYAGCSEACGSSDPLRKHIIAVHHGGDANAQIDMPGPSKLIGDFKCEVPNCWEAFFQARDLSAHTKKMHPELVVASDKGASAAASVEAPPDRAKRAKKRSGEPDDSGAAGASSATAADASGAEAQPRPKKKAKKRRKTPSTAEPATDDTDFLSANEPVEHEEADDVIDVPRHNSCAMCGKPAGFECTGCFSVRYCSSHCQTSGWKTHMSTCKMIQNAKKSQQEQLQQQPQPSARERVADDSMVTETF
jgi:hypothetical protein